MGKFIEKNIIDETLKNIPQDEYASAFSKMANKEWMHKSKLDLTSRKRSFYKTVQSRGWEFDLINKFLSGIKKNKL